MIYRLTRFLIRLLFWLIARVQVYGMENVDLNQSCIAAGNHTGRLDPGLIYLVLDRQDIILFVAEKYRKYPPVRWLAKAMRHLGRSLQCGYGCNTPGLRRLKQGGVMVSPRRHAQPQVSCMRASRSQYLAVKAGVPIVPQGCEDCVVISLKHFRCVISGAWGQAAPLQLVTGCSAEHTDEIMCHIAALLPEARLLCRSSPLA
jgi:hypothetical protein